MDKKGKSIRMAYEVIRNDFTRAGEASSKIKRVMTQLGIQAQLVRRAAIATYEAEMNIVIHSLGGKINVTISPEEIEIKAWDSGPGIRDIQLAMKQGFSTASNRVREMGFGAGMGLPNIKKFSDDFKIESAEGRPTEVTIKIKIKKDS